MAELPATPELPTDYPRRPESTFCTDHQTVVLSPEWSIAARKLTEAEQSSAVALFLAAVQVLLVRYTDSELVTTGILDGAGELTKLITTECPSEIRVRRVLQTITAQLATSTFILAPSWPVLFSSAIPAIQQSGHDLALPYDLHFTVGTIENTCYAVTLAYNSNLFRSATVTKMLAHLRAILEAAIADPEALVWRLRMLSAVDWHKLVVEWNSNKTEQSDICIHELFESQAELTPESLALQFGDAWLSYEQLNVRANQLARYLRKQGVGSETPVGILLERSLNLAVALLAVLKAAGACVCLDPQYPSERLAYMVSDARISVLITERHLVGHLDHFGGPVIHLSEQQQNICCEDGANLSSTPNPDGTAFIIYTSGSTGKPKGILLAHRGLVNHHRAAVELYDLKRTDRVLQFSSIAFDIALEEIFPTWVAGAAVVLRTHDLPLDVRGFFRWIAKQDISLLDLPTAYWHELIHQMAESPVRIPESLRMVIIGGEKASVTAFSTWLKLVGTRVRCMNTYGPSETSIIATACELKPATLAAAPSLLSIGRPIANTQIYILDHELNLLPIGVPGELYIGGIGVARGYVNRPELTQSSFLPDPLSPRPGARLYKTGDRGRWLPSGEIEFLGRGDFQVKVRGYRVEPSEVEAVLLKDSSVHEAAVVANTSGGMTRLIAYIVPTNPGNDLTLKWRALLKANVPEYMIPSAFVTLPALPLTPNGKVDRTALKARDVFHSTAAGADRSVSDPVQSKLLGIWQSVLGIKAISISDNFWDLGGNSLLAARLIQNVERILNTKLTFAALVQAPSIEQLAKLIEAEGNRPASSCLVPLQPLGSKPPFFCVHGVGGTVLAFRALATNMGPEQPFYGLQAQGLDEREPCLERVEDMANRYIEEIQTVQPRGPYHLGGFSFGGWVAWEMAQQLTAKGEEVGLLALLDTYPFRLQPITSSLMGMLRFPTQQQLMYVLPKTVRKGIRRRLVWLRLPQGIKNVQRACYQAEKRYVLRRYAGRVTLFCASESLHDGGDPHARWHELAGTLDLHDIPGHHGDIIIEPDVMQLAQELRACIDGHAPPVSSHCSYEAHN